MSILSQQWPRNLPPIVPTRPERTLAGQMKYQVTTARQLEFLCKAAFVSLQNAVAIVHRLEARLTARLYSAGSGSPQASPDAGLEKGTRRLGRRSGSPGSLSMFQDVRCLLRDPHQGWPQVQEATCSSFGSVKAVHICQLAQLCKLALAYTVVHLISVDSFTAPKAHTHRGGCHSRTQHLIHATPCSVTISISALQQRECTSVSNKGSYRLTHLKRCAAPSTASTSSWAHPCLRIA